MHDDCRYLWEQFDQLKVIGIVFQLEHLSFIWLGKLKNHLHKLLRNMQLIDFNSGHTNVLFFLSRGTALPINHALFFPPHFSQPQGNRILHSTTLRFILLASTYKWQQVATLYDWLFSSAYHCARCLTVCFSEYSHLSFACYFLHHSDVLD